MVRGEILAEGKLHKNVNVTLNSINLGWWFIMDYRNQWWQKSLAYYIR